MTTTSREIRIYDIIDKKAASNIAMQGLSGVFGFPFTLVADVAVFFSHYGTMLNEIREVYGLAPVQESAVTEIIKGCKNEVIADLLLDKIVGQMPLVGIAANMMCAKAMTWRLGILFGMLSARGDEINAGNVDTAVHMIRQAFPQRNLFKFTKPSVTVVEKLLKTVEGDSVESFNDRMMAILEAMA